MRLAGQAPWARLLAVTALLAAALVAVPAVSAGTGLSIAPIHEDYEPSGKFDAETFLTVISGITSKPSVQWTLTLPPAVASCDRFVQGAVTKDGSTGLYEAGASWLMTLVNGGGAANGCPDRNSSEARPLSQAVVTVVVTGGSRRCTATYRFATDDALGETPTCGAAAPPKAKPSGDKASRSSKATDGILKQAANLALTFELRQLPVLLHKPHIRKAIFTHFTSQTRALIDRKLKQKKIAQAEQAKTHARLQRELRQGWKKVWDVRAELESYKDLCNRYVDAYDTVGKFEALVSAGLASVPGGALFLPLTMGMGGAARIAGAEWGRNAADPPDKHYTALVTPTTPTFPAIPAAQGVPAGLVDAATTFLADDGKAIGLVTAFRRSFERAQGAAAAGNAAWTARQLGAAATFADSAAAALGSLPADLTALRQQLSSAAGDPLGSAQSATVTKLGAAAAPDRLLPALAASTTKAAAALRALGIRLKALATS